MKVYLITSGLYSEYHIDKAFSTEALAEKWIGSFSKNYNIEEYELDDLSDKKVDHGYIEIGVKSSKILSVEKVEESLYDYIAFNPYPYTDREKRLQMYFDFYDEEKMIKIASEKRAKILYNLSTLYKDIDLSHSQCFDRETCLLTD